MQQKMDRSQLKTKSKSVPTKPASNLDTSNESQQLGALIIAHKSKLLSQGWKEITFEIKSNGSDLNGNPLPKLKMTGKQHWLPKAQKYVRWKNWVRNCMMNTKTILTNEETHRLNQNVIRYGKPLNTTNESKAFMEIQIFWANKAHGDPENVFGSIADALFINDKNLDGIFTSQLASDKLAKVVVVITLQLT